MFQMGLNILIKLTNYCLYLMCMMRNTRETDTVALNYLNYSYTQLVFSYT